MAYNPNAVTTSTLAGAGSGALSGALSGAALGGPAAPFTALAGAVLGGIAGGAGANQQVRAQQAQESEQERAAQKAADDAKAETPRTSRTQFGTTTPRSAMPAPSSITRTFAGPQGTTATMQYDAWAGSS